MVEDRLNNIDHPAYAGSRQLTATEEIVGHPRYAGAVPSCASALARSITPAYAGAEAIPDMQTQSRITPAYAGAGTLSLPHRL